MDDVDLLYSQSKPVNFMVMFSQNRKRKTNTETPKYKDSFTETNKKTPPFNLHPKRTLFNKKQFKGVTWMSCWKLVNG